MNAFFPFDITRRLDKAEAFFWFLDRLSSMNFAFMAEGHGPLDEDILASAFPQGGLQLSMQDAVVASLRGGQRHQARTRAYSNFP